MGNSNKIKISNVNGRALGKRIINELKKLDHKTCWYDVVFSNDNKIAWVDIIEREWAIEILSDLAKIKNGIVMEWSDEYECFDIIRIEVSHNKKWHRIFEHNTQHTELWHICCKLKDKINDDNKDIKEDVDRFGELVGWIDPNSKETKELVFGKCEVKV